RTPGPLRAFHERTRVRRGNQIASVAVARKLTVLAWHLLHDGSEYRWSSPTLTAGKWRRVELQAGASRQQGGWPARLPERPADSRTRERRELEQAEMAYRRFVTTREQRVAP